MPVTSFTANSRRFSCDRAEMMHACALEVSKIERRKTTTHAVESLIKEKRLVFFDLKMFTYGNLCKENIDKVFSFVFLLTGKTFM